MIEAAFWDYDGAEETAAALPGGKTPVPVYAKLAAASLPWKRVSIVPGDDRLIRMDSELSNVRALAKAFLPAGARIIQVTADIADYRPAGNSADGRLHDLPWPLDLVWLGMGEDGHSSKLPMGRLLGEAEQPTDIHGCP